MKKILVLLFCVIIFQESHAQLRPQVHLIKRLQCDTTPYKLVFFDDFNGHHLDTAIWTTYISWHGISKVVDGQRVYGDNDHFCGSRINNHNAFYIDENVVVSEGTCKLLIKNEAYRMDCVLNEGETNDGCNLNTNLHCPDASERYYTAGGIFSKFRFADYPDGSPHYQHFNNGRFEARLRHPVFEGAWTCMWTWHGTRVNEIDITEAYGGKERTFKNLVTHIGGKRNRQLRQNAIAFHAWNYKGNPYGFPDTGEDAVSFKMYNNQEWVDYLTGKPMHLQDEFHTYTCEWDTAVVRIYLDGKLDYELWKYYKYQDFSAKNLWGVYKLRVPGICNADTGTYLLSEGFPYEQESMSQLRLTTGLRSYMTGLPVSNEVLGIMEIDYVKIWQRHPEKHHNVIYPDPKTTLQLERSSMPESTHHRTVVITNNIADSLQQLYFTISNEDAVNSCIWYVSWTTADGQVYSDTLVGKSVSTTSHLDTSSIESLKWIAMYTNEKGEANVLHGYKMPGCMDYPLLEEKTSYTAADNSFHFLQAKMNWEDWEEYNRMVKADVASRYVYDTSDTQSILDIIHSAHIRQFLPYLYFEDKETYQQMLENTTADLLHMHE